MDTRSGPTALWYTVLFFAMLVASISFSNWRYNHQIRENRRLLEQRWRIGYDTALGKPADQDWLRDGGVYYVRWIHAEVNAVTTNYYGVIQFMGTDPKVACPEHWETNMLFVLPQCLEKGRLYMVEKRRSGLRFTLIKRAH